MKNVWICCIWMILSLSSSGQEIDSLKNRLASSDDESERLGLYVSLADALVNDSEDQFAVFLDSAYSLSRKIDEAKLGKINLIEGIRLFRFGQLRKAEVKLNEAIRNLEKSGELLDFGKANHFLASTYANQDDYYASINYYEKARDIYVEVGNDEWLIKAYANMGWCYRERGDLQDAMDVYMKALRLAEKNNSLSGLFDVYHELGYIYIEQGDTAAAERTFLKTLDVAKQLQSRERISYANGDLAILYFKKKNFDQSLKYNKADLAIQIELGNKRDLPMIYNNISDCFFELADYDSTIFYAKKSLEVDIDQRSAYENAQAKINIAKANIVQKEYNKAENLLQEALKAGETIHSIDIRRNALNQLYSLYYSTGNDRLALEYFQSYHTLLDSIFNLETNRQIEEIRAKYELDKSQQQIINLDLEKRNALVNRNLYLVAFVLAAVIGLITYFYSRHIRIKNSIILKREKKLAEGELEKSREMLMLHTKMLSEKNALIDKLNKEYEKVKGEIKMLAPDSSKKIRKLIKSSLLTDPEWEEFKNRFEQIYPYFFIELRNKFPGLTNTEEKLFALSKLKLKNKEIGGMLGISPGSVTKSKYRLGKKLNIVPEEIELVAEKV